MLHSLYSDVAGHGPTRLANRVMIRHAGLSASGHPDEEWFLSELAETLVHTQGKLPIGKRDRGGESYAIAHHAAQSKFRAVDCNLREAPGFCLEAWGTSRREQRYEPSQELPAAAQEKLRAAWLLDRDNKKTLAAFLPFVIGRGKSSKNRAGSCLRQDLVDWMNSKDGREWRQARAAIFDSIDDHHDELE